ncbi:histidine phosphatase family protein [Gemmatimonadota bacterium]
MKGEPIMRITWNKRRIRSSLLTIALLIITIALLPRPIMQAQEETIPTTIFLVRHAEKVQDGSANPALTSAGMERAIALADLLEDAGITAIHSTDFIRTRDTVVPLAERLELPITIYDPRNLAVKAALLKDMPGRHVVSGHSNTTPELVRLLGGDPGPPMVEAGENDRLYIVTLHPDGTVGTVVLRFGKRFRPGGQDPTLW